MSDTLGFGIIGCGSIGPFHAEAISRVRGVKLRAACDVAEDKAIAVSRPYGCDPYTDYREMLKRKDIDVVNICLPSGMHAEVAVAAAKAGKHVIVEKPLDISLDTCDRIIEACARRRVKLAVVFPSRFKPAFQLLRKALDAKRFGKVVLGEATTRWYRSTEYFRQAGWRGTWKLDGGGALMNQGIHTVDVLQWLMGPVDTVFGHTATLVHDIEVEDTAVAALKFKNGALGVIEGATSMYPGVDTTIAVYGETGTVMVEGAGVRLWEFKRKRPGDKKVTTLEGKKAGSSASDPVNRFSSEGHRLQIQDMVKAIRANREPYINGEEGRKAVEIILAVYKSTKVGRPVTLPLR